jgi:hypothetical protein
VVHILLAFFLPLSSRSAHVKSLRFRKKPLHKFSVFTTISMFPTTADITPDFPPFYENKQNIYPFSPFSGKTVPAIGRFDVNQRQKHKQDIRKGGNMSKTTDWLPNSREGILAMAKGVRCRVKRPGVGHTRRRFAETGQSYTGRRYRLSGINAETAVRESSTRLSVRNDRALKNLIAAVRKAPTVTSATGYGESGSAPPKTAGFC